MHSLVRGQNLWYAEDKKSREKVFAHGCQLQDVHVRRLRPSGCGHVYRKNRRGAPHGAGDAADGNDTLRRERDDAVAENDTLRLLAEEDARLRDDNTHLEQQVQALQQQLAAVQAENDALRGPAGEYQSLKEHVADIEISAHRRTEEFRARAMERLGQCIAQQRLWCSQRRSTYLNMNTALAEQLRAAQEAVDSADFAAFDDMIAELQRLEDELKKPDPQL